MCWCVGEEDGINWEVFLPSWHIWAVGVSRFSSDQVSRTLPPARTHRVSAVGFGGASSTRTMRDVGATSSAQTNPKRHQNRRAAASRGTLLSQSQPDFRCGNTPTQKDPLNTKPTLRSPPTQKDLQIGNTPDPKRTTKHWTDFRCRISSHPKRPTKH